MPRHPLGDVAMTAAERQRRRRERLRQERAQYDAAHAKAKRKAAEKAATEPSEKAADASAIIIREQRETIRSLNKRIHDLERARAKAAAAKRKAKR